MLAFNLVKQRSGQFVLFALQPVGAQIVKNLYIAREIGIFILLPAGRDPRHQQHGKRDLGYAGKYPVPINQLPVLFVAAFKLRRPPAASHLHIVSGLYFSF